MIFTTTLLTPPTPSWIICHILLSATQFTFLEVFFNKPGASLLKVFSPVLIVFPICKIVSVEKAAFSLYPLFFKFFSLLALVFFFHCFLQDLFNFFLFCWWRKIQNLIRPVYPTNVFLTPRFLLFYLVASVFFGLYSILFPLFFLNFTLFFSLDKSIFNGFCSNSFTSTRFWYTSVSLMTFFLVFLSFYSVNVKLVSPFGFMPLIWLVVYTKGNRSP